VAESQTPPRREPTPRVRRPRPPGLWQTVQDRADVLAVIAVGGALGSAARWALGTALPHEPGQIPLATLLENVTGAAALGVLMVLLTELLPPRRYTRPFWGVGVLGGYTTFSTYMLDTQALLLAGRSATAAVYLFGTLVLGLAATWAGITVTRSVITAAAHRGRRTPRRSA
jgi:CrcB protein